MFKFLKFDLIFEFIKEFNNYYLLSFIKPLFNQIVVLVINLILNYGLNMFFSLKFQRNLKLVLHQNFWPI